LTLKILGRRLALPAACFGFLAPGACSVHSLRACHLILEHRAVSPAELARAHVPHALAALLDLAQQQPGLLDAFLPEVLSLLASLLEFDRLAIGDGVPGATRLYSYNLHATCSVSVFPDLKSSFGPSNESCRAPQAVRLAPHACRCRLHGASLRLHRSARGAGLQPGAAHRQHRCLLRHGADGDVATYRWPLAFCMLTSHHACVVQRRVVDDASACMPSRASHSTPCTDAPPQ
jgi:hypothetical protein